MIALAGPAANLAGAAGSVWLATVMWSSGSVPVMLWLLAATGVWLAVANLRVAGAAPMWRDAHEATSVPPPQAPS